VQQISSAQDTQQFIINFYQPVHPKWRPNPKANQMTLEAQD
jgi:hypothetical protein